MHASHPAAMQPRPAADADAGQNRASINTAKRGMKQLRRLERRDHDAVLQVYRLAVLNCPEALYSAAQRRAWARQADDRGDSRALRACLQRGLGLVSVEDQATTGERIAAFAVRDPADRIALLYCHPEAQRHGHGRALLQALEAGARREGIQRLRTEASLISRSLFEAEGWQHSWREELQIHGVHFHRFRLHKPLAPILDPWPKPSSSGSSRR
ncbi:MAG: hypothetical protein RLZZ124_1167 [Cyanobacteriota bacterium]